MNLIPVSLGINTHNRTHIGGACAILARPTAARNSLRHLRHLRHLSRHQPASVQRERAPEPGRWAAHRVVGTVCYHRHEHATAPDGEAFHAYPIPQELPSRLKRRAFAVMHRQQVDEGAAAAWVDEDDYRGVGNLVTVEVAKSDQVAYQSGMHLLRRARAVLDRSLPLVESNRGLLVPSSGRWYRPLCSCSSVSSRSSSLSPGAVVFSWV